VPECNLSPHNECSIAKTSPTQPISSITGLRKCSPLWEIINGLLGGATASGGAFERQPLYLGGHPRAIFRVCILGLPPQDIQGTCDHAITPTPSVASSVSSQTAMFAAFLGT
jgi:hypothetical protein